VDTRRIVVDGGSRGAEIALLLAIHYPDLVHGVIAVSPTNVVLCGTNGRAGPRACIGPAFTLNGKPLPYTRQWGDADPTDTPAG
jgi:pimeloyl-ACP methyl ester carboxylesterase